MMLDYFLTLKKKLGRSGSGQFSSLLRGAGIDLADHRVYAPGDDTRSINRKMSAKYDKLFVNLFHEEKAIDVALCCDINYNRRGNSQFITQSSQLNNELFLRFFVELTNYFQSKKGHVTGYIDHHRFPSLEKIGYQKSFLETFTTKMISTLPVYSSSLPELLTHQLSTSKQRLIIIVSDFLVYGEEEENMVRMLRQKHDVVLFGIPTATNLSSEVISLAAFSP